MELSLPGGAVKMGFGRHNVGRFLVRAEGRKLRSDGLGGGGSVRELGPGRFGRVGGSARGLEGGGRRISRGSL
jgi:hypothetical protein